MSKGVAIFTGNDSGGSGVCNTSPAPLSPPSFRNVFVNGQVIMVNGDTLSVAPGTTSTGDPCSSTRVVQASRNIFVGGQAIAATGDSLNSVTGITIPTGSSNVFVV
jgi:uncharacterized Zn-binding protein involved in type VI secretion